MNTQLQQPERTSPQLLAHNKVILLLSPGYAPISTRQLLLSKLESRGSKNTFLRRDHNLQEQLLAEQEQVTSTETPLQSSKMPNLLDSMVSNASETLTLAVEA